MDISTLGIAVDSRQVENAITVLNRLVDAGGKAETSTRKIGDAARSSGEAAAKSGQSHVDAYRQAQSAGERYLQTLQAELAGLTRSRAEVEALKTAQMGLTAEHQRSAQAIGAQIEAIKNVAPSVSVAQAAMAGFGVVAAAAFAVAPVLAFSRAMFDASAQAQRVQTALDFATGGKGASEFAYIRKEADLLGLAVNDVSKSYSGFMAAARGTALEGDKARAVFEATAKASAVMGLSAGDTSGVLLALQQMLSKGTVQAEELRGQLSERLPGGFQIAARAMGVTTQELGKMLEQGQVISSDFLPKFARQLETELGGAADSAANRLDASVNRFENAFGRLKQSVGDAGVSSAYAGFMDRMTRGFNNLSVSIEGMTKSNSLSEWWYSAMYTAEGLDKEIDTVRKQLADAEAALAKAPSNIYFKSATADVSAYLEKLLKAKAAQDEIVNGPKPSTGDTARADRAAQDRADRDEVERTQAIRASMEKVTSKLAGIKADFYKDLNALYAGYQKGLIGLDQYRTAVAKLIETEATDKDKNKGARAAAERDAQNAEIEELKRGQAVKEEIAKRGEMAIAAAVRSGAMTQEDAIRAVAELDIQRLKDGQAAIEKEIAIAERKKNSQKEVANLQGQLQVTRERQLTREIRLQYDLQAAEEARQQTTKQMYNAAENQSARDLQLMVERNKATKEEIETIGLNAVELQRLIERRMDYNIQIKEGNLATQASFEFFDKEISYSEMTREAIDARRDAIIDEIRARNLDAEATKKEIDAVDARVRNINEEILKLEQLKEARLLYTQKASATQAAAQTEKAYSDAWRSIDQTAHDVFVNVAENGMGAFERIGKTLKAAVLDMLYQLTIRKWLISIGVSMFGSGFANAAGVIGSSGGVGGIGGLFNTGSLITNSASSIYSGGAQLYSMGLEKLGGYMMDFGNWMSRTSATLEAFGTNMGYANAAIQAFKGNWGAAAGSAIGAYLGGPIGSFVGNWLGGLVDKFFSGESRSGGQYGVAYNGAVTNQRRGETYYYEGQKYNEPGPQTTRLTSGQAYLQEAGGLGKEGDAAITKAVASTAKAIDDTLAELGSSFRTSGYWAGLETSGRGRGGVFAGGTITSGGQTLGFGSTGKGDNYSGTLYDPNFTFSPDATTAMTNFTLDLKMSYAKALQAASDIPDSIKKTLQDSGGKWLDIGKMTSDEIDALLSAIDKQITAVKAFRTMADMMPLESLKKLSFDAASELIALAGGIDTLSNQVSAYYQNYYSDTEQQKQQLDNLGKSFNAVGLTMIDLSGGVEDAKAQFKALMGAQDLNTDAGRKAYAMLLSVQQAFLDAANAANALATATAQATADINKAALTAAQKAVDQAMKELQKAVDTQKATLQSQITALTAAAQAAQESIAAITAVFDVIDKNVKELYGEVASTSAMQAAAARKFISDAVSAAQSTGYLPDSTQLDAAVSTARGAMTGYASQTDADRARLTLAAQLSILGDSAKQQKSTAELQLEAANNQIAQLQKQMDALDKLVADAQAQLDAINGNTVATLTVAEAVNRVNKTLQALANLSGSGASAGTDITAGSSGQKPVFGGTATAGTGGGSGGSGGAAVENESQPYERGYGKGSGRYWVPDAKGGHEASDSATIAKYAAIWNYVQANWGSGDAEHLSRIAATMKQAGYTQEDIGVATGMTTRYINAQFDAANIPRFDIGTNYVPADMLALIHEGEAVVPKAYNPAAGAPATVDNSDVVAMLNRAVQLLADLKKTTDKNYVIMRSVTQNGDSLTVNSSGSGTALLV